MSTQIAVEQNVAIEHVRAHGSAQCLLDPLDRRQAQARCSGSKDDRSDDDMQPVETTGSKEA